LKIGSKVKTLDSSLLAITDSKTVWTMIKKMM